MNRRKSRIDNTVEQVDRECAIVFAITAQQGKAAERHLQSTGSAKRMSRQRLCRTDRHILVVSFAKKSIYGTRFHGIVQFSPRSVEVHVSDFRGIYPGIVEIDAGDTYAYDSEGLATQKEREDKAKERIFSLLPEDQKNELISLFDEFEAYETPESKFAHSMDNFQPLILNNSNEGGDWKEHDVTAAKVYGRQSKTRLGSEKIYEITDRLIQENIRKGNLKE